VGGERLRLRLKNCSLTGAGDCEDISAKGNLISLKMTSLEM